VSENKGTVGKDAQPDHEAKYPGHKQQRKTSRYIRFVREVCHHTFHEADVPFQRAM
jgi:hypothetical protein